MPLADTDPPWRLLSSSRDQVEALMRQRLAEVTASLQSSPSSSSSSSSSPAWPPHARGFFCIRKTAAQYKAAGLSASGLCLSKATFMGPLDAPGGVEMLFEHLIVARRDSDGLLVITDSDDLAAYAK